MAQVLEGMRFATRLVAARKEMGLGQERLANRHLDVTKGTVANWESGKTLPGFADLQRCCEVFGWDRCEAFDAVVQDELDRSKGPFITPRRNVALPRAA